MANALCCIALLALALFSVAQNDNPAIKNGDVLEITGNCLKEDVTVPVRSDGTIILPLLGDIKAEGLTLSQLEVKLEQAFSKYIKKPTVIVRLVRTAK
jgi:protein involved in polysaccharide export with SLBB domain